MKLFKIMSVAALGLGVAGCASVDTVSRNAPLDVSAFDVEGRIVARSYVIEDMTFAASSELSVSESNSYYPSADVVWRGDPIGDRIEQIGTIFETATVRNQDRLDGNVPVVVDFELVRFHGVTERTRFSIGGVYNIVFTISVRNAITGEIIEEARLIEADLSAPGGIAALMQEQRGQTEKVRVTDFLTQVFKDELSGTYNI
ncbi:MAG: hypothetical protein ACI82I_000965 [Gammaproteobacteria bacterium]|jgi:hypothetical protein